MSESAATGTEPDEDAAELGYEAARDQLIEVVRELEAGGLTLEQSLTLWERGEHLANICERHLEGARERVEAALSSVEAGGDSGDGTDAEGSGDSDAEEAT